MDSASQTDNSPEHPPSRLANLVGILVALLTLTLPLAAIAHFSSGNVNGLDQSSYPLPPDQLALMGIERSPVHHHNEIAQALN